jgi:hypothetical protein
LEYWKDGTMGSGLRLVEPTARKGKWDNGLLEKFHLIRKVLMLNKEEIPLKPTFQYSITPSLHVRGKNSNSQKRLLISISCTISETLNKEVK